MTVRKRGMTARQTAHWNKRVETEARDLEQYLKRHPNHVSAALDNWLKWAFHRGYDLGRSIARGRSV